MALSLAAGLPCWDDVRGTVIIQVLFRHCYSWDFMSIIPLSYIEDVSLSMSCFFVLAVFPASLLRCSPVGLGTPIITCPLHFISCGFLQWAPSAAKRVFSDKGCNFTFSSGHKDNWNAVRGYSGLRKRQPYVLLWVLGPHPWVMGSCLDLQYEAWFPSYWVSLKSS